MSLFALWLELCNMNIVQCLVLAYKPVLNDRGLSLLEEQPVVAAVTEFIVRILKIPIISSNSLIV